MKVLWSIQGSHQSVKIEQYLKAEHDRYVEDDVSLADYESNVAEIMGGNVPSETMRWVELDLERYHFRV